MKITVFLTLVCLHLSAAGLSQAISLSVKDAPLETVFQKIEQQTGYYFFYKSGLLKDAKSVTLQVTNASLTAVLDKCFDGQPLIYTVVEKGIFVKRKETTSPLAISPALTINGKVVDENGQPVVATITIKGAQRAVTSNEKGIFVLENVSPDAVLIVTSVSYESVEYPVNGQTDILIRLKVAGDKLDSVSFTYNTGYQAIPQERSTGSFVQINNELLNRRVSTNVLDRLDGITSGLIFNKNPVGGVNQSDISIRSRSTIYANPNPLIILDNYPYDGDLNNINPNDIESITVLKDAAAASIWGSYSGNGVIVVTTKKGKYGQATKISFNSNVTVGDKPDLWYTPRLSTSDYIDMEQYLFDKGYYNSSINSSSKPYLSPIVEILLKQRNSQITPDEAQALIGQYRGIDNRKGIEKYAYRYSTNQQYSMNLQGGTMRNKYYFSAGYDKNLQSLVSNSFQRITVNANNTYAIIPQKLELETSIIFASTINQTPSGGSGISFTGLPYMAIADAAGNPLATSAALRQSYVDTAGNGALLDWNYRPLDELRLANHKAITTDYRLNLAVKYQVLPGLDASLRYQYSKGVSEDNDYRSQETYDTRNLINSVTQINPATHLVTRPVPLGGVLASQNNTYQSHNARGQLSYSKSWAGRHAVAAIGGIEIRSTRANMSRTNLYGFDPELQSSVVVDYLTRFPYYYLPSSGRQIPNNADRFSSTDNNLSYYANASYTYQGRYTLSASGRKDESNIYGVDANQKGVPLWSTGVSWLISREPFYHLSWVNYLKLRATNGYNGNVDKTTSAYVTAATSSNNSYGANTQIIQNPPNPALRWEKIHILNLAADISMFNDIIMGSVEFYWKNGKDVIADMPLSPSVGLAQFRGNAADMTGKGFDITLNTKNITGKFSWVTTVLVSKATDKVSNYKIKPNNVTSVLAPIGLSPIDGKPLYALWSLKWAGLDPQTGDPQGFLDKTVSKEYGKLLSSSDLSTLVYSGPQNPVYFGSLRNTFSYKQLELSINITFKAGHYFRRPSYDQPFFFADYPQRWQQPGDELLTSVPSFVYPDNSSRRNFYTLSEALVEKADHIRLQDIQLSYDWHKRSKKFPLGARFYLYSNNLGILWKATKTNIDPDYVSGMPNVKTIAIGAKIDL